MTPTPPTDPFDALDAEAFADESRAWRQREGLDKCDEVSPRAEAPIDWQSVMGICDERPEAAGEE